MEIGYHVRQLKNVSWTHTSHSTITTGLRYSNHLPTHVCHVCNFPALLSSFLFSIYLAQMPFFVAFS
jgi:hypothetical protein